MRLLFSALMLMLGCAGSVFGAEPVIPADKALIRFDTRLGTVTFDHRRHADLSFTECSTCHHTWEAGETIKPCHACHEHKGVDSPVAKTAFHTRCIGCHEYTTGQGDPAGPVKKECKLCHVK
jgi:hypothetical protein